MIQPNFYYHKSTIFKKLEQYIGIVLFDNCLTIDTINRVNKIHALPQKKITIRDLARNTRAIKEAVKKGQSYVVYEKTEPIFDIYPTLSETNKKYSMLELQNLRGFIAEKPKDNRSIDEIVYGT